MNETKNLLLKLFILLTLGAGWSIDVWAARFTPTFEPAYNADGHWYYIKFTNQNFYMYSQGANINVGVTTTAPDPSNAAYWWQPIGSASNFVLVNGNGQYLKLTGSGGNNGFYQTNEGESGASHLCLDQFGNGSQDVWEIKNLDITSGRCHMNPQSNSVSHWNDNDNGNRMIFEMFPVQIVASPAPSNGNFSSSTKWYSVRNERANSFMSTADTYVDANGLKLRQSNQSVNPTNDEGFWCFVLKDGTTDQYYIYNRASGPFKVLGTKYNGGDANARSKMYEGLDAESGVGKVYQIGASNKGYWLRNLGDNGSSNWFLDDSKKTYFTVWNNASNPKSSDGNRFFLYNAEIADVTLDGSDYTLTPANGQVTSLNSVRINITKAGYEIKSAAQTRSEGQSFADVMPVLNSVARATYTATGITPTGTDGVYDITFADVPAGDYTLTIPTAAFYAKAGGIYTPIASLASTYTLVYILDNNVKLKFIDENGNTLANESVIYTPEGGSPVSLASTLTEYNFNNVVFSEERFSGSDPSRSVAASFDKTNNTLTFVISYAQWFSLKNHRRGNYISVGNDGLEANQQMKWGVTSATTAADYWCLLPDGDNGYRIFNKAYGWDYVFGLEGTGNGSRMRMYHLSQADATSTHFDKVESNTAGEYCIFLHSNHNVALHDYNSQLAIYAGQGEGTHRGDDGSKFIFTEIPQATIAALPDYTVYRIDVVDGSQTGMYFGDENNLLGQKVVQKGRYMVLKSSYTPVAADFNFANCVKTVVESSLNIPIWVINLSGEEKGPVIVHRRAYFYDKYNSVSDDLKPRNSSYVGRDGDGWMMNGTSKIQKTSEYRIPVYLKPGTYRQMYMPTDKLAYYQRWYNYKTEGLVNTGVMPVLYSSNFKTYSNGHVSGKVASGIDGWQQNPTFYLPTDAGLAKDANGIYEDYIVGVDVSRFKDNSTDAYGNLTEPTLSQRVLFEIKDANKIAKELTACTGDKWLESRNIIFPTIKRGNVATNRNTGRDALPIDMDMWNYWVYNASHELVQLTNANQIVVEVDDNTAGITASLMPSIGNNVGWGGVNFNQSHFISFEYPGSGTVRTVPDNSHATVKVYFVEGSNRYQLAKFELTFVPGTDPKIITEVIGKKNNGEYKSERSPYSLEEKYGKPVAELTFDNKNILMKDNQPAGGVDGAGGTDIGTYLFPLNFAMTNYAYGYEKGDGTARGEYTIANARHIPGGQNANFRFKPVQYYYDVLNGTTSEHNNDQFYIYVDASDQPGEVMSLSINDKLCAGTRLYVSGWMSTTSNNSNPASVILNLVAKKSGTGESKILTSYCPGMLHTFMYDENGNEVAKMNNTTGEATSGIEVNTQYWGLWSQISFSFLLTSADVNDYDEFQLQVLNNCYNSSGGDYLLDNFQIFANPPRAEVDFTTPLCSDKVRHVKVHTDFNMLKNLSNVNENVPDAKLYATFCFVNSKKFDEYQGSYAHPMSYYFTADDRGNHVINSNAYNGSEVKPEVLAQIDEAFGAALVGERTTDKTNDAHGFHVVQVPAKFNDITPYAYNDSQDDTPYRETVNGVDRVVFKEPVVRAGEDDGKHLHSSTEYYIVFAGNEVTTPQINAHNTATHLFGIQTVCSFFGKFKTKDPLHIILDNADIESDLPVKAVCHGESVGFSFNMPALKADKPIVDEEYCTSDESLDGQIVPSTNGARHYRSEESFKLPAVKDVVVQLPYDWWMGGKYDETHTYRATLQDYLAATHPSYVYNQPEDIAHKQHGQPVKIAQAMEDFRFYYPEFGKDKTDINGNCSLTDADWATVTVQPYNSETGYGLLQSEINTIKDLVTRDIIMLHRNTYNMSLTANKSEQLTNDELSKMTSNELNSQILALALELDNDASIASLKPLKALEGTVLETLSPNGRKELTFQEFANEPYAQVKAMAQTLLSQGKLPGIASDQINTMPESELRKAVESALRAMSESDLRTFAMNNFTDIGPEKRAHLVIRALNIMNDETLASMTTEQKQNTEYVRATLRQKMINIFKEQQEVVLRKMWNDESAKLTAAERTELLNGQNPNDMNATQLATLIESGLAVITNNIIAELSADKYIHFTLVPIMPSQQNFVDEQYIFCPEPRGVKVRIRSQEPQMLDGFADMPYPSTMTNVPVRIGLQQIKESKANAAKTLRIPVRGLQQAVKGGVKAVKLAENTGYYNNIFLVKTDDPAYKQSGASADTDGLTVALKNTYGDYSTMVGTIETMVANYPTAGNLTPDNYLIVKFDNDMNFREGYTYRVGINFMENDKDDHATLSCFGTMLFDMKIVPEYQKWTATLNNDWTNDGNWARADRGELNAANEASDGTKPLNAYITNEANQTANSFVPMYFTNVLFDKNTEAIAPETTTPAAVLYGGLTEASHTADHKNFLGGLQSTATDRIVYDMEVAPSTGAWHADNNYECTLFGTYIANGITFKPGSQLINAQHLTYNKAWVEYELATNRWYTLASPLQNTFAGEWYSPKAGGKQLTPHFYDITYQQGAGSQNLNDRFRPAYYQRSWDSQGNNPVYLKTANSSNETEQNAYIMADWSYVYNDVRKEYSNGGFSVMVDDTHMEGDDSPADHKALNRMPKADTQYTYFDFDGNTAQQAKTDDLSQLLTPKRNRLWSDELNSVGGTFQHTITNATDGNNFFLVANPFMANMDMDAFFAANSNLEKKYWIMTAGGQDVSVKVADDWVGTAGSKVAPLQGFFVTFKNGQESTNAKGQPELTVTYNAAMQATPSATAPLKAKGAKASSIEKLTIKATRDDISSTAVIALCNTADKKFVNAEDAETFIDSNIADQPTIYTVASGQAMTVNTVPVIDMIPLGIVGEADGTVAVTFSGMSGLCLYDSKDNSYTDINEGTEVTMEAKTAGRYFITSSSSTTAIDRLSVEKAERKGIYTLGGQYVGEDIKSLAPGLYIVNGVKMRVK